VAWMDHKAGLAIAGANHREFFHEARHECIRFLQRLERNANQNVCEITPETARP
jgi:hypothetical protein